ncbi:MAG: family 10 glycosylhydrolase [Muribaculaceae bacterium]|nr:family 10 glycosylhydrolase [Muribaculaceae bacterium]
MRRFDARLLLISFVAVLAFIFICPRTAHASPKYEMRGAWLVTAYGIDWPSCQGVSNQVVRRQQQELDSLLTQLHRAGINAVFFQVRPMADALYESSYEPWSGYLTGSRGSAATYDPLARCVACCHALGMECHAWINPFRVGTRPPSTMLDNRISRLWMTNCVGKSTMTIFNPALDETREHLCNVCREIAEKYDIDGIVFDDYFYNPEFIPEDCTAADWKHYLAAAESGMSMADWRRENINRTIADVYAMLSSVKDGKIRFGVSPQGIGGANGVYADEGVPSLTGYGVVTGDSQYDKIYSDPVRWLRDGLVDYISPQIYWTTDNPRHPYGGLSRWWNDVAEMYGRHCFPSQTMAAFDKNNTPDQWKETLRQIELNREYSFNYAPGTVLYSSRFIVGKPGGKRFSDALRKEPFSVPALVPPMRWKPSVHPIEVTGLTISGSGLLKWDAADDARYVIYAVPDSVSDNEMFNTDCDGIAPEYIIAITYDAFYTLPVRYRKNHRIAVSPYDRYGVEWQPSFLN